jgi:hypothetical protein
MMPETAREEPPPGPGCAGLRRRMDALLDRHAALMADIAADPDRPDLARRMTLLTAAFREARAELAGHVFADAFAAEAAAQDAAREAAAREAARHRAPGMLAKVVPLRPKAAHGLAPAAALAVLGGRSVRSAVGAHVKVGAHLKLGLTAAAAAGVTAASVTYTMQTAPYRQPVPPASAQIAPAAASPSSSPDAGVLHQPKAKGKHHRIMPQQQPQLPAPATAAPSLPAPPSPAAAAPLAGTLDVQNVTVTFHRSVQDPAMLTAEITIRAAGGPVHWWASPDPGLTLDDYAGILQAGQTATVTVSADAASALPGQSWTITLQPGDQPVTVTAAVLRGLP